jgi:hypothetical protein
MIYARIEKDMVVEVLSTDNDITKMFHSALVWLLVTEVRPVPRVGWFATKINGAWKFTPPVEQKS